ncbi:MAG: hypothetical protein RIR18_2043 [Pseudomonadota bacterium]|jgi:hypothetical protein
MRQLEPGQVVGVGGDFARVFDPEDYLVMINAVDEATVILRAHLVLEEFLNIWARRITSTEDLFDGGFIPFKTKLFICKNLGLASAFVGVFDQVNTIRNRYSHRRKYILEESRLLSLRDAVNALPSQQPLAPCEKFEIHLGGEDASGGRQQITHNWATADTKKRLALIQVILVLKIVQWMQQEFNARGIKYNLVVWPADTPRL